MSTLYCVIHTTVAARNGTVAAGQEENDPGPSRRSTGERQGIVERHKLFRFQYSSSAKHEEK